ncbi:phospholipase [Amycolatopsis nigrescens]|uniref:phospholipase n=1 Tax=Amycolatopsis nigrescens TaxID=381445 RepID=UPI000371C864|nr:phospholipase [Amycolatopsis nigrescens]
MTTTTLRRRAQRLVGAAAVTATLFTGAGVAQAESIESITDDYLFSKSLSEFSQIRDSKPYPDQLDWSSDACSWSPDKPVGFDFKPGCHRHDFGYRNYKKQGRFNDTSKKRIDDNFYSDLKGICGGNSACNGTAWVYYQAVRQFG